MLSTNNSNPVNMFDHQVDGWSGLSLATRMGFLNIVKKLLENGADPNLVTKVSFMNTSYGSYN